ncbi:MAG TPA: hypothetical protein ENN65_08420 [Candidatus Hydrogenedentes bacterium]|nr:hypothetical protein [Candidatus Hydrogenedentota bacterium]
MDFPTFDLAKMAAGGGTYLPRDTLDGSLMYAENGKPITLTFPGVDSPQFRDAVAEIVARKQARLSADCPQPAE